MKRSKKTIAMLAVVAFLIVAAVPMALASSNSADVTATPTAQGTGTYTIGGSAVTLKADFSTAAQPGDSGTTPAASSSTAATDSSSTAATDSSSTESNDSSSTESSSTESSSTESSSTESSSTESSSSESSSTESSSSSSSDEAKITLALADTKDKINITVTPSGATVDNATWTSTTPATIAAPTATDLSSPVAITALATGTTTIKVTADVDGESVTSNDLELTVTDPESDGDLVIGTTTPAGGGGKKATASLFKFLTFQRAANEPVDPGTDSSSAATTDSSSTAATDSSSTAATDSSATGATDTTSSTTGATDSTSSTTGATDTTSSTTGATDSGTTPGGDITSGGVTWSVSPSVSGVLVPNGTTATFGGSGHESGLVVGTVYNVTATQNGQTVRFAISVQTPPGTQQSSAPAVSASNGVQTPTTPSASTVPSVAPGTVASQPAASASAGASASTSAAPGASSSPVNEPVTIKPDAAGAPEDLEVIANPTGEGSIMVGPSVSTPDEKTTVQDVLSWVVVPEGGSAKVVLPNGQTASDDAAIGTGMVVQVLDADGNVIEETIVVVKGDVLGTGEMSLTQLVNLAQAFTGAKPLEGVYNIAADLDGNGSINLTDLVMEAKLFKDAGLTMTK